MKICLLLVLLAGICFADTVNNEYFTAFVGTLEIDASISPDCNAEIGAVLAVAKRTLEQDYRDVDILIDSVIEFIDKLKYDISPACRSYYEDFEAFMEEFDGNADYLREDVEANLDVDHAQISREILCGLLAGKLNDPHDEGKLHANVYRRLLGLPISELVISPAVLEEEKRYNEEIRSDRPLRNSSSQKNNRYSEDEDEDATDAQNTNSGTSHDGFTADDNSSRDGYAYSRDEQADVLSATSDENTATNSYSQDASIRSEASSDESLSMTDYSLDDQTVRNSDDSTFSTYGQHPEPVANSDESIRDDDGWGLSQDFDDDEYERIGQQRLLMGDEL